MRIQLVDAPRLAAALCIKVPTVRTWLQTSDDIPVIRIGRLVRFDPDAVLAWLREGGPGRAAKLRAVRSRRVGARGSAGNAEAARVP